jgi:hypothetical protein
MLVCTVPSASAISKCILEAVLCEGVLRICLDHLDCIKMANFQFYLLQGKQRKVGWVVDDSNVAFGKKFLGKKEVCNGAFS